MKRFLPALLLLTLTLVPDQVEAFGVRSGGALGAIDSGASFSIGYPRIDFNYFFAIREGLEFGPEFSFFYGLGTTVPVIGNAIGTEIRLKFMRKKNYDVFLYFEPALMLMYDPEFAPGVRIGGPGVLVSYRAWKDGIVMGGFKFSPVMLFEPDFLLSMPMVFSFGGVFRIHKEFNLFVEMEFGPDIRKAAGSDTKTYLYINTVFGLERKF